MPPSEPLDAHISSLAVVLIVVIMWLPVCVGGLVQVCVWREGSVLFPPSLSA